LPKTGASPRNSADAREETTPVVRPRRIFMAISRLSNY
jgi:hypothetical protein